MGLWVLDAAFLRAKNRPKLSESPRSASKKSRGAPYLEYSTCTGAGVMGAGASVVVGISRKLGIERSGGADESPVQHPQEVQRIAMTLAEMARK